VKESALSEKQSSLGGQDDSALGELDGVSGQTPGGGSFKAAKQQSKPE